MEVNLRKTESLQQKEVVDFLNKNWMTHDGMWFFHCLQNFGIETTNKLNKSAIKSLAPIEIARIKKTLGCESIENFDEFKAFFAEASKLLIPDFMGGEFTYPKENMMAWGFNNGKCFAHAGVKMLGVIDHYECGVIFRIRCWLDELEISHQFNPEIGKCRMHISGSCSGEIQLFIK